MKVDSYIRELNVRVWKKQVANFFFKKNLNDALAKIW